MRPAKRVVVAGDSLEQVSLLRYLLYIHKYWVAAADGPDAALQAEIELREGAPVDLLVVAWPLDGAEELLEHAKAIDTHTHTLLIACTVSVENIFAFDAVLSPAHSSAAEILAHVKVLTARKRGPRPGTPHPKPRAEQLEGGEGCF